MGNFEISDSILLNRLSNGDYVAFKSIYERHIASLYSFGRSIRMDLDDVEDAIQEVFASLWIRRDNLNILDLKAWLISSLHKQMLQKLRKKKYQANYQDYAAIFESDCLSPNSIIGKLGYDELLSEVNKQLDLLSPQKKNVFILSRFHYKSHKEIAQDLNISELTVKKQINNVLKVFRKKFSYKTFFTFLYSLIIFCATT